MRWTGYQDSTQRRNKKNICCYIAGYFDTQMATEALHNTYREDLPEENSGERPSTTRLLLGLLMVLVAVYVFFSSLSYFFTGSADQSVVENYLSEGANTPQALAVENWLGFVGALTAHHFVYHGFGVAGLLVLPVLFFFGLKVTGRARHFPFPRMTFLLLFLFFWAGILLGYLAVRLPKADVSFCGGVFLPFFGFSTRPFWLGVCCCSCQRVLFFAFIILIGSVPSSRGYAFLFSPRIGKRRPFTRLPLLTRKAGLSAKSR